MLLGRTAIADNIHDDTAYICNAIHALVLYTKSEVHMFNLCLLDKLDSSTCTNSAVKINFMSTIRHQSLLQQISQY